MKQLSPKGYYITEEGKKVDILFHNIIHGDICDNNGYSSKNNGYSSKNNGYSSKKRFDTLFQQYEYQLVLNVDNVVELVIPRGYHKVICAHNKIEKLTIPQGVQTLLCAHNKIEKLVIPKSLRYIHCTNNPIKEIIRPNNSKLRKVVCNIDSPIDPFEYLSKKLEFELR